MAESKKRIQVSLSEPVFAALDKEAANMGISKSALITLALTEFIEKRVKAEK